MKMNLEIKIHQGFGDLYFGMPIEDAILKLGHADDIEVLDDVEEMQTTVLHYTELGMALFFEESLPVLKCVDTNNKDAHIKGIKIFEKKEQEITQIMKDLNFIEEDVEIETWEEKRITFFDASIDFFFEKEKLTSVVFGK